MTDQPVTGELARRYGRLVADAGTCSCHVHVGIPSRDIGVQVLARLRPWLASLLAITVNSPIADGRDTAWASWRYPLWSRWPTATAPAVWGNAAAYDATVRGYIADGAALDQRGVYILARLSPRYPTVEVRVADVCLDPGTAVLLAGLTRALVATALAETRQGAPVPAVPARWVDAALTAAARYGLTGPGIDPFTGQTADARILRSRLLGHVHAALRDRGDTEHVTALVHRLDGQGTGADRQRALFAAAGSAPAFVEALARATLYGDEPAGRRATPARQRCRSPGAGSKALAQQRPVDRRRCPSGKEAPAMTGSFLVPIITPIVAVIALAFWLGMIFWAEGHPGWKAHPAAHESRFPGETLTLASDLRGDEPAPPQQETKAA